MLKAGSNHPSARRSIPIVEFAHASHCGPVGSTRLRIIVCGRQPFAALLFPCAIKHLFGFSQETGARKNCAIIGTSIYHVSGLW
jgi:hypothetical protein